MSYLDPKTREEIGPEFLEAIQEINRTSYANTWKFINPNTVPQKYKDITHRLNSLGDNFYFMKIVLRKHRLSNSFHRDYCDAFMSWSLQEVFEIPRDHFKTTIGAVGMPLWWALPFTVKDEIRMRDLGYDDSWIDWMKRAHDQNTRTLIAMEVIKNAWKVGRKIATEYEQNRFFQRLFPEIMPDSSCPWNNDSLHHKRDYSRGDANQGEGTYEFTGVDAALQSKHYCRMVLDDLFGKEALKSELVAESTWEWVKLLVGAFDSKPNSPDEIIDLVFNGNRWSYHDLNWRIRQNLPGFKFHTHDAEGGCCDRHPVGQPIFPEEWSFRKLARMRVWLGDYFYSCQFRNKPILPGGNTFKAEWLRYFAFTPISVSINRTSFKNVSTNLSINGELGTFGAQGFRIVPREEVMERRHMAIRHEIKNGVQQKDIPTSYLAKMLLVDPNHAGEKGRANNVVLTVGVNRDPLNLYLLDIFARTCSREDTVHQIYRMGERWRIRVVWVEGAAGQTWLKTLLEIENEHRRKDGKWYFYEVKMFADNRTENAKSDRIEDTEPYFRRGQVWVCSNDSTGDTEKFKEEYNEYPHSATRDVLDTLGHAVQNLDLSEMSDRERDEFKFKQEISQARMVGSRNSITGY